MSDITDQDQSAYEWAQMAADNNADPIDAPWRIVARHYLATVEAPAPTLAEELRELGDLLEEEGGAGARSTVWARDLANRVEQTEQERDEARKERNHYLREVENVRNWKEQLLNERDEARADLVRCRELIRKHKERTDRAVDERDEALAAIEIADWKHWFRDNQKLRAEVARLKAINHTPQPPHSRGLHS